MSVAQLKSFTLMNTTKNQVYFSAMEKVVVRKDGENRPSSPGEKVKKAGKEWEATAGKKRKKPLFDAGEEFSSEEEEEEEERKTHVRGPGEEEDFFSPVKQPTSTKGKGRAGGGKRSRGGAGIEETMAVGETSGSGAGSSSSKEKKEVKWDRGLVWIRARKNQPLELELEGEAHQEQQAGSTRGRKPKKGCMKSLDRPVSSICSFPLCFTASLSRRRN